MLSHHMQFHQTFMIAAAMLSAFGIVAIVTANYNNYAVIPGLISFSCVSYANVEQKFPLCTCHMTRFLLQ